MPKPPTELPDHQVTPNPMLEKRTRRQFSTEYKLRILAEADACQHGELGQLLRREKLYNSQLTTWRKELAESGVEKLHKTAPGPTPSKTPEQKRIEALERENARLQQRLSTAEDCLSLQKKSLIDARSPEQWERTMITVLEERPAHLPMAMACRALGINRSTVYAWRKRRDEPSTEATTSRRHCPQPRALSAEERAQMLEIVHSEPYRDQPVYEIYHDLLQQGIYLGSLSTWYRQLREAKESGDRRPQRAPQHHAVPRITARAANEAWTWDISKLPTRRRGVYLNLYVVLDLYSRFIVAWMVSHKENAALARQLFQEAVDRYGIPHGALALHQDRGSPMIARSYLDLMGELGVTCSHSRPRVSNDNPFSESQFKTSKYQPGYPGRFESIVHAQRLRRLVQPAAPSQWAGWLHARAGLHWPIPRDCRDSPASAR